MQTLIGLLAVASMIWGIIYFLIWVIKGGKKAVYHQIANKKKVEQAREGERHYVFSKNIYVALIFPTTWILAFCALFFSSTDFYSALFGVLFLCWFMVFKIYYIIRSRKDKVILYENKIEFHFSIGTTALHVKEYADVNLEFQKLKTYDGNVVLPFLIFAQGSAQEIVLTNAALCQYPFEITEALGLLNPHLKLRKTWNDTIKKKNESVELSIITGW